MSSTLIPFCSDHIPLKVQWVNDPQNNRYLHYDLPLTVEGTTRWWEGAQSRQGENRLDFTISAQDQFLGLAGLLDLPSGDPELYVLVDHQFSGKGVATAVLDALARIAFERGLTRCHATIEEHNNGSLRAFEKASFHRAALLVGSGEREGRRFNKWWVVKTPIHDPLFVQTHQSLPTPVIAPYKDWLTLWREDLQPFNCGGFEGRVALASQIAPSSAPQTLRRRAALSLAFGLADWALTHQAPDHLWVADDFLAQVLSEGLKLRGLATGIHLLTEPLTSLDAFAAELKTLGGAHMLLCSKGRLSFVEEIN